MVGTNAWLTRMVYHRTNMCEWSVEHAIRVQTEKLVTCKIKLKIKELLKWYTANSEFFATYPDFWLILVTFSCKKSECSGETLSTPLCESYKHPGPSSYCLPTGDKHCKIIMVVKICQSPEEKPKSLEGL